jgi:hypothetical protein
MRFWIGSGHPGTVSENGEPLAWCVVANVAREIPSGPGGLEIRRGTRHFSPGTKVWVLPPRWGDGAERLVVIGRHRGSRRHVRMVMPRRHLTGFRAQGIYSPTAFRRLTEWGPLWKSREQAEYIAADWSRPLLDVVFTNGHDLWRTGRMGMVLEPPPLEIEHDGQTYYLAHFNANRAVYSTLPPPPEPR